MKYLKSSYTKLFSSFLSFKTLTRHYLFSAGCFTFAHIVKRVMTVPVGCQLVFNFLLFCFECCCDLMFMILSNRFTVIRSSNTTTTTAMQKKKLIQKKKKKNNKARTNIISVTFTEGSTYQANSLCFLIVFKS